MRPKCADVGTCAPGICDSAFPRGSGSLSSPAGDGAASVLAKDKTKPDGCSAFRYVIVQRRKALKSSSLYILLVTGLCGGAGDVASTSPAFRELSDHLATVAFETVAWLRHETLLSLPMENGDH